MPFNRRVKACASCSKIFKERERRIGFYEDAARVEVVYPRGTQRPRNRGAEKMRLWKKKC